MSQNVTSTLRIKRNDTGRTISDTLTVNGAPLDLTGASVDLLFRAIDGSVIRRTADVEFPNAGGVRYDLISGDVATAGTFSLEWEVTLSDGGQLSFPQVDYHTLIITPDLG